MAGVKGRSGRKSKSNEEYKLETIDECWKLVRKAINDESLDIEIRLEIAKAHTVKSIPTEIHGNITSTVVAMGSITRGNDTLTFNIGAPLVLDVTEDSGYTDTTSPADNGV